MERMNLDHWFINENTLSISLMNFYIEVSQYENCYQLRIINSNMKKLDLYFNTMEDAVEFTESVVSKCFTFEEILDNYGSKKHFR